MHFGYFDHSYSPTLEAQREKTSTCSSNRPLLLALSQMNNNSSSMEDEH